jgi:flavin reductase ActVB
MDSNLFRRACAQFATGVAIASVLDPQGLPHGMTINSFTSVSMEPPLVLICIDRTCNLLAVFERAEYYGLSFLGQDQQPLSARFAQRGQDRFDGTPWVAGSTGVPLIPDALAHLQCRVTDTVPAGDHVVLIAEVISADIHSGTPLLFYESGYRRLE